MRAGAIKWFGTADGGQYGFLKPLAGGDELFFHKNAVCKDSKFLEKIFYENLLVVYEPMPSRKKPGKLEARHVKLLIEATEEEKAAVVENEPLSHWASCFYNADASGFIRSRCQMEPLDNLLQHLRSATVETIFRQRCMEEPVHEVLPVLHHLKKSKQSIKWILQYRPEFLEDPALCATLNILDLDFVQETPIISTPEQLKFFRKHLPAGVLRYVLRYTDVKLLLGCKQTLSLLDDDKMVELVSGIDWNNTEPSYLGTYQPVFPLIEADTHIKTATAIAISMREQNAAFHPIWWKMLTDSVKIRILIYQSNFPEERPGWFSQLQAIYEQEQENKLLLAVLKIFVNLYPTGVPGKAQKNFMQGHEYLMTYILDCFQDGVDVTHGLNTLLDKCQQGYGLRPYFCDARIFQKANRIYCPEGLERPGSYGRGGRRLCDYYEDTDLTVTRYKKSQDYSVQYFMDLIVNIGFWPDLRDIQVKDAKEYPFRMAAFVNRLLDLRPHMKCSHCGKLFHPNFAYTLSPIAKLSTTRYYCPETTFDAQDTEHDSHVYINYCYHCKRVIDSRECEARENGKTGQWQCMRCGGTQNIKPGTKCPAAHCGNKDLSLLKLYGNSYISCQACGYDGRDFQSTFEQQKEIWHTASNSDGAELPF